LSKLTFTVNSSHAATSKTVVVFAIFGASALPMEESRELGLVFNNRQQVRVTSMLGVRTKTEVVSWFVIEPR
jgi:hypothetical protein